jgi:UDP-N-acetylmuramoyl-tripeptide--D-alanyl-D-alanine ligase
MGLLFEKMTELSQLYELYLNSSGVTTDSRSVREGEIFFALRGPNFDGNRYAAAAIGAGAMAAVVDDRTFTEDRYFVVDDVLSTLAALANYHRRRLNVPVIGVTGSNGKTTTRELITAVLSRKKKAHSTAGNLNNHIGVPLTLLGTPDDAGFVVVEMGANHKGEIDALCEIAMPTHGIITNIGIAHIEGFGSLEDVKKAKSELYRWLGRTNGIAIYNDDNPVLKDIIVLAGEAVAYSSPADKRLRAVPAQNGGLFLEVNATIDDRRYSFATSLFGSYNIDNVRAAMATGLLFDVAEDDIIDAISSFRPANNRSQVVDTGKNIVICDAYNANPASMQKTIASFADLRGAKKMVILGDMLELGSESDAGHASVIEQLENVSGVVIVLAGPNFMKAAVNTQAHCFNSSVEIADWLRSVKPVGYDILVKGSRGMMMEKVYPLL